MDGVNHNLLMFSDLTIEDRGKYLKYYLKADTKIADQSFVSRLTWAKEWGFLKAEIEDSLLIFYNSKNKFYFSAPLALKGRDELIKIVNSLKEGVIDKKKLPLASSKYLSLENYTNNDVLSFLFVEESQLYLYQDLPGFETSVILEEDYSDYLYPAESMRTYAGKKLHAKRNFYSRFWKKHPDARYISLKPEHFLDCLSLMRLWMLQKKENLTEDKAQVPEVDSHCVVEKNEKNLVDKANKVKLKENNFYKLFFAEYKALKHLFETLTISLKEGMTLADFGIAGGTIYDEDKLLAFAIYSTDNLSCPICHFEKAHPDEPFAYPVIARDCIVHEFPYANLVNREEDLGIEGLRKNKLSYRPSELLPKYMVILKPKR